MTRRRPVRTRTMASLGITAVTLIRSALPAPSALAADLPLAVSERYRPIRDQAVSGTPYVRYRTVDRFGRTITFYLGSAPDTTKALPLAVFVQGSGGFSLFSMKGGRIAGAYGQPSVVDAFYGRARLLVVEKPGVAFLTPEPPSGASPGSAEFRREHTLPRWSEAVEAAVQAARTLPEIRRGRLLVMGHSEGALVACRVARDLGGIVTHVASISGGGPTQLFDLLELTRQGRFLREVSDDPDARVRYVLGLWDRVLADPENPDRLFLGQTYRRWSSFASTSPIEELRPVTARIYIAQGLRDDVALPESADALDADLLAHGKDVTYDRVPDAGHSFETPTDASAAGWRSMLDRVAAWFDRP
ncbi:MAG: alpha/beta hydrolase family protein [Hyphomicrobiales bacterium]